jgi:hypothetical protein
MLTASVVVVEVVNDDDISDCLHGTEDEACATMFACTVRNRQGLHVIGLGTSGAGLRNVV